jgi:hypothetical protein
VVAALVHSPAQQDTVDNSGNFSSRGLGLRLIHLQRAVIVAQAPNLQIDQLFFPPDGSALYAESLVDQSHMALLRHDPSTLAVAALHDSRLGPALCSRAPQAAPAAVCGTDRPDGWG